ncbi:MAG: glycosyltransferase family 4 protein [Mycobacteriales bacterium]
MPTRQFLYVLEQTLGNAVHGDNVLRAAEAQPDVSARALRVHYDGTALRRRVPVLGNWTVEASWRTRRLVRRALAERPADALFVNTLSCGLLLPDVMRRVPTVVSMDSTPLTFDTVGSGYGHAGRAAPVERAKLELTRRVLARAAAVTTWSQWAADSVVDEYGVPSERVRVIRPGARLDRFRPPAGRPRRAVPRLLFVGGDFARKGGYDLLRAMELLGPVAELDVVTSAPVGPVPPGTRVHLGLGHDSPELFDLYQRADVFVVPSTADVYGLVYPEAMACALPVVAADVGAVRELVVPGETGLIVPPGAPEQLAAALRTLVERPDLRVAMGRRGLTVAREQHDADLTCAQIVELMRTVAGERPRPVRRTGQDRAPASSPTAARRRPLALVSASADLRVRDAVKAGTRPCPEYLRLEWDHDVELLPWRPGGVVRGRPLRGLRQVGAAVGPARRAAVVFSDGEHVGLPLGLVLLALRVRTPHVMLGHHLSTGAKRALLRRTPAVRGIDRILVHSASQAAVLTGELGVPAAKVHVVPYGVDTDFWQPRPVPEQHLVVSAGREHRDYATLAAACADLAVRVFIADGSSHSPGAHRTEPVGWPANVERRGVGPVELRDLYAAAGLVVVPVLPTDFPAGITTILEAMAMGRALVVTGTEGLRGVVRDGVDGVVVPAGDAAALRAAVRDLLDRPEERARLGAAAREAAVRRWSLTSFADVLARHLTDAAAGRGRA